MLVTHAGQRLLTITGGIDFQVFVNQGALEHFKQFHVIVHNQYRWHLYHHISSSYGQYTHGTCENTVK
jgi:hypothetical protein